MVLKEKQISDELKQEVYPVRIKFSKTGNLQYISHLDLNRSMTRAIIRAKIPIWYTEGFNPHPKLVFSSPLSVGVESVCEFCDIRTTEPPDCERIKSDLNSTLPPELRIIDVYAENETAFPKFSKIAWAEYNLDIVTKGADKILAEKCRELLTISPLIVVKKSKKREREIDLAAAIRSVNASFEPLAESANGKLRLNVLLPADSSNYLNPELVIRALIDNLGILSTDELSEYYSILRIQQYFEDGRTVFA